MARYETYCKKRKSLIKEQRKLLLSRLDLNKRIRNIQREMNSLDSYLLGGEDDET